MENYKKLLLEKGIKPTFQRIKILEYLQHHKIHPTVDMIYAALFNQIPTLSKTTVYNTLDKLRKEGLVNVLTISESELRYEYSSKPHHHFLCKVCKNIIDVDIECPYLESRMISDHKVEEIHGYFRGICKKCLDGS